MHEQVAVPADGEAIGLAGLKSMLDQTTQRD